MKKSLKQLNAILKRAQLEYSKEEFSDIVFHAAKVCSKVFPGTLSPRERLKMREKMFPSDDKYQNETDLTVMNIGDYNQRGMKIYGANVTLMRAVPDILDGLKPVERRSLYAMAILAKAVKKYKKALAVVGTIITIHPHGDIPLQDTLVSMSREWVNAYPLIDTQSNKGVANGLRAAALRYMDIKISEYAYDCFFKEWDENIMEMSLSYNREQMEPDYIPPRFPNILVRSISGFTFSAATSFPSFNLEEAFNETIKLIKDPNYEPFMYPDLPSGCAIVDEGQFKEIYRTGKGKFTMKAECEIDREHSTIYILNIPFGASVERIIKTITTMVKKGDLHGIKDIYDHSDRFGINIKIVCAPDMNIDEIVQTLYKKTCMTDAFSVIMQFVDDFELKILPLKDIMQSWIDNRRIMKEKFVTSRWVKLGEEQHILDALIEITSSKEKSEKMINDVRTTEEDVLVEKLCKRFKNLTSIQAGQLIDMKVRSFSPTRNAKLREKRKENAKEIASLEDMIKNPILIDKEIISELKEAIAKYSRPRMCRIIKSEEEKEVVDDTEYIIVFTKKGLVKKINKKSNGVGRLNDGDDPVKVCRIKNTDSLVVFDKSGLVHTIRIADIPQTELKHTGIQVGKFAPIHSDVVMGIPLSEINPEGEFVFVTEQGMIKKTKCDKYKFKNSVIGMILKEGDGLASAIYNEKDNANIIIYTKNGIANRFTTNTFSQSSRLTSGVIGIDVANDDAVMGMTVVRKTDTAIAILTDKGNGKICDLDTFKTSKRRGTMLRLITLGEKENLLGVIPCNEKSNFMVVMKKGIIELKATDFKNLTRNHKGQKMIPVANGDVIIRFIRK